MKIFNTEEIVICFICTVWKNGFALIRDKICSKILLYSATTTYTLYSSGINHQEHSNIWSHHLSRFPTTEYEMGLPQCFWLGELCSPKINSG